MLARVPAVPSQNEHDDGQELELLVDASSLTRRDEGPPVGWSLGRRNEDPIRKLRLFPKRFLHSAAVDVT